MRLSAPEKRRGERPVRKGRRAGIVQARRPEIRGCAEAHPFKSPYWPRDEEAAATWRVAGFWFGWGAATGEASGGGGREPRTHHPPGGGGGDVWLCGGGCGGGAAAA